jgi:subtilisin family serine protease
VGDKINAPIIGNTYRDDKGGTSTAAAAVSGALAILKEKNPDFPVTELVKALQDTGSVFKYPHAILGQWEGRRLKLCASYSFNGKSWECGS